jgi:hypothetical protein
MPTFVCCRYIEEHVQKTGVAIETQGFVIVTSGKKRESLTVWAYRLLFVNCFSLSTHFHCNSIVSAGEQLQPISVYL